MNCINGHCDYFWDADLEHKRIEPPVCAFLVNVIDSTVIAQIDCPHYHECDNLDWTKEDAALYENILSCIGR
jgi:hypothetical protein